MQPKDTKKRCKEKHKRDFLLFFSCALLPLPPTIFCSCVQIVLQVRFLLLSWLSKIMETLLAQASLRWVSLFLTLLILALMYAYLLNVSLQQGIIESLIYSSIGLVMALIAFKVIDLITPGKMSEQIAKENNIALAIIVGSLVLGVCIIIAKVISGN
jgi:putative membrane protein